MIYFINLHMLLNVTSYNIMCLYLTCEVKKILIQSTSVNGISAYVTFDILTEVMKLTTTLLSMSLLGYFCQYISISTPCKLHTCLVHAC